jgi:epoxyqueuosine reductase
MLIKMKEKNLFNYLESHNIDVPENINLAVISLPSLIDKSVLIQEAKSNNRHANMKFTFSNPQYSGLGDKFEWAKSCVVISYNYFPESSNSHSFRAGDGAIALFASEDHYKPLNKFINKLTNLFNNEGIQSQQFIDSPQHYDRIFFNSSGLGWQGKSTMMLSPGIGPWQLIGNLYTEKRFKDTEKKSFSCGTCNMCQISCPTGALDEEYRLDSNKCLSYWLQSPDIIPEDMRINIGNRFYGCDECLTSCPPGQTKDLNISKTNTVDLKKILTMSNEDLVDKYSWFYIPKRNGDFLKRNALIALANNPDEDALKAIYTLLKSDSEIIRFYAIWAIWKISQFKDIENYFDVDLETSDLVKNEYLRLIK